MESIVAAIISVALILFATMSTSQGTLTTAGVLSQSWKEMESRTEERVRTDIRAESVSVGDSGRRINITVVNEGSVRVGSFEDWDVVIQYTDGSNVYHVMWVPYDPDGSPEYNEWGVTYIQFGGDPEVFEPDILNPGEDMQLRVRPNPGLGNGRYGTVLISTPNGVTTSIQFTR
jgi:hypothetical protein